MNHSLALKLTPYQLRTVRKVIPFGLLWAAGALLYSVLEKGILGDSGIYPSTGNPYQFFPSIFITLSMSVVVGLLMGLIEALYFTKLFEKTSFGIKILIKTLAYVLAIFLILLTISTAVNSIRMGLPVFHPRLMATIWAFLTNFAFLSIMVYVGSVVIVILFISDVIDNIGLELFKNFLVGKYHRPREEDRIFLFVDLKSSTTIAEKLGHLEYFELLKAYYADISEATVHTSGEIKEYVGDQMTISWTLKNGLRNLNCLRCFFRMKQIIQRRAEKYQTRFGFVPQFKAGMHCGPVTTGEIGNVKRDIIFTGDVLNTTARIQDNCNSFGVDILISESLWSRLDLDGDFESREIGEVELKGKHQKVRLFTVQWKKQNSE